MFRRLRELFGKKLQKVSHLAKKHEKSSIWPKLATFFEQTTMFRRLGELSGKEMQKVPHFAKKHEKSSIWPKRGTFLSTLLSIGVWVNFEAKGSKTCLISRKSVKNRRFG